MMDQSFMKTKPVLPLVVSMSMPMVLSMLVNALYNIVDSFFIARISEDAMLAPGYSNHFGPGYFSQNPVALNQPTHQ